MSSLGVVPIRPSPQKLPSSCVVLSATPVTISTASGNQSNSNRHLQSTPPKMSRPRPLASAADTSKCKRKVTFSQLGYNVPVQQPATVARRNARERNRVKQVNLGFATLRQHIPNAIKSKKMSKVDTLKQAVEYIQALQDLLNEQDAPSSTPSKPPQPSPTTSLTSVGSVDSGYAEGSLTQQQHYCDTLSPTHRTPPILQPLVPVCLSPGNCSDASSPTPSYMSENSSLANSSIYDSCETFGGDNYDSFGVTENNFASPENYHQDVLENLSPEDEELLDVIAWWQQSQ